MKPHSLKLIVFLILVPLFGYYILNILGVLFTLGFASPTPWVWSVGAQFFGLMAIVIIFLLILIGRAQTNNKILSLSFLIIFTFSAFFVYLKNADRLWRIEANMRGIDLIPENKTYAWRSKHCHHDSSKDTICVDPNPHYFSCDDSSANFCGF